MAKKFEEFKFNKQLLTAVEEAGYTEPTPIQEQCFSPALNGQDIMGVAQTGTGKTVAFVLPMLMKLHFAQGMEPRALVLAPTRELAIQLAENITQMAKHTGLRCTAIYGGIGTKQQKETLSKGIDILVATPGRFLDLYLSGDLVVKKLNYFVIDEADKMLDMGFIKAIHRILEVVPRKRQNLLFSATMSDKVKTLAGDFLAFPVLIEVERSATPAPAIEQKLFYVPNITTKTRLLEHLLKREEEFSRVIIFCKTRLSANNVFKFLERKFGAEQVRVIHANKGQNTRLNSINTFREGNTRLLVATDVAARGIDVSDVSHVINFDVPLVYEDYVHRIGRTGRAMRSGVSITFCNDAEKYHIQKIQKLIRQQIPVETIPAEIPIDITSFEEQQMMLREIDNQRKKEDPTFQGAFHERKNNKAHNLKRPSGTAKRKR